MYTKKSIVSSTHKKSVLRSLIFSVRFYLKMYVRILRYILSQSLVVAVHFYIC